MRDKKDWLICCLIFLVSLSVYLNSGAIRVSDAKYTLLLSEQIIDRGTFRLDEHFWSNSRGPGEKPSVKRGIELPYQVREVNGHLYSSYAYGTAILSIPFVLAYRAIGVSTRDPKGNFDFRFERVIQKNIASILMALACVIFYLISRILLPRFTSIIVTVTAGFGTQVWSTASTGLWSHTWKVVLLSLVCLMLLRGEKEQKFQPVVLASLLSWGYFVRPTAVFYILPITIFMWLRHRSLFLAFLGTGMFWLGLFLLYAVVEQGGLPFYYTRNPWSLSTFHIALSGQLLSPYRGLLVYVPSILIVGYLLFAYRKSIKFKGSVIMAIAIITLHVSFMAMLPMWWAGVGYGPRIHTGLVPVFVLLGVIGIDAARNNNQGPSRVSEGWLSQSVKGFKMLGVSACIVAGIFVHGVGAMTSYPGWSEDAHYHHKYRPVSALFDWRAPPFLCEFSRETFCPKLTEDQIIQEFESVDLDNNSSIDGIEFKSAGFRNFRKLDRDKDNQINFEEWQKLFRK